MKFVIFILILILILILIFYKITNKYENYEDIGEDIGEDRDMIAIRSLSNEKVNGNRIPILINLYLTFETGMLVKALYKWNFDITVISHGVGDSIDIKTVNELKKLGVNVIYNLSWTLEDLSKARKEFIQKNGMKYKILLDEGAELYYDYLSLGMENVLFNTLLITEQTSWGIYRLKQLNYLPKDVYSVSDSILKIMADNYLSVSEGIFSTIIQYGGKLISGSTIFVVGYGPVGSGIADRAKLLGANTIISEIDPVRAYLAFLNGHSVMKNEVAVKISDIIITATGKNDVVSSINVIESKKGCLFLNAGHGDKEITFPKEYNRFIKKDQKVSILPDQKKVLAQGKVANIYLMRGNPPETMDLSFSLQLLLIKDAIIQNNQNNSSIKKIPYSIEQTVANILCLNYKIPLNS
jgi:adenosylhomocysteinase